MYIYASSILTLKHLIWLLIWLLCETAFPSCSTFCSFQIFDTLFWIKTSVLSPKYISILSARLGLWCKLHFSVCSSWIFQVYDLSSISIKRMCHPHDTCKYSKMLLNVKPALFHTATSDSLTLLHIRDRFTVLRRMK